MNRFEYTDSSYAQNETFIIKETNVRLYDGDQKTPFENGEIHLTTHRLIWTYPNDLRFNDVVLSLPLQLVMYFQEESPGAFSFGKSKKLILYLHDPKPDRNEGPQVVSLYNFIKFSFKEGYTKDMPRYLSQCLEQRKWEEIVKPLQQRTIELRTGIAGIERKLQEKHKKADESISIAFQDLSKLMVMAKDMVRLSNNISNKIKDKQGDITEDETIRFKSYLLSLGIDDPVTRDSFKSDNTYFRSLAKQISDVMFDPITEVGGMMALTDVFCRVNRARGLELLSPEDLLNACKTMEYLGLPLKMHKFDSGVIVLKLTTLDDANVSSSTKELIDENGSLTAEELARILNVSVILARERLFVTENFGKCCRDDNIEGLRFYPNWFLTKDY
ncbi:vacuolar protein-sorting-associated protein 36 [Onthophagus taurus]|uniref:vacuolar protein-sorting-associated protein 36 n=1 Tax=Onthophagus taurus TaxID=166361 RepID=UPI0039BDEC6E